MILNTVGYFVNLAIFIFTAQISNMRIRPTHRPYFERDV